MSKSDTKMTNYRLPEITRNQIERLQAKCGYKTGKEVVVVAIDRMAAIELTENNDKTLQNVRGY